MAISFRYLIPLLVLFFALEPLRAQPATQPPPVRTTTVQFYYYSVADNSMVQVEKPIDAWLQTSSKTRAQIELSAGCFGSPTTYVGNGPLVLFTEKKNDKGTERKVIATLPLPADVKGVFYIVTYTPGIGYKFTPLPYSNKDVPEGAVKVINLTQLPLQIKIADKLSLVPAQSQSLYDASACGNTIPIKVARMKKEKWRMFIETSLPGLNGKQRTLYVFVPDSATGTSAKLLQLGDLPDPPEKMEE